MKKIIVAYFIYLIIIWSYFLYFYPLQSFSNSNYAAFAHAVYFSKLPMEWILLYGLYKSVSGRTLLEKLQASARLEWLKVVLFSLVVVVLYGLIRFPFNLLWYRKTHIEGTSRQPFHDWLFEMSLDLMFYWVILSLGLVVIRLFMAKFNRMWWFFLWLVVLPATVFVVYIQPVWIDPLYEDYNEMEEGPLKSKIESFVDQVGLEDATLLQVNMSEKVTTFNAYVTGIFGNARIVLWDTTLNGMEQDEIMFILAHEIGHYVKHHVYLGVAGYLVFSFFLFYLGAFIYRRILRSHSKFSNQRDLRVIPLLLLTVSLLSTAAQPISMYVSREIERSADEYAIAHTENLDSAIQSYQRLAIQSKSDINPVFWVKWIRYSHPPTLERMELVEQERMKRE
ncbi:M48 family metalloprotease [Aquibacillus albus]|uniref:Zn-dependent protease with chaperone function n=1 Tax=Aquibacillus albus TaxID=1168171 RepID=A0ABS2N004_9BACI|nr:M48 family metalloprotease [Aquibacillus albus]MBM7571474.1 Zn-dependent protease with chaperone function [Aquibacillus albus]